MREHETAAGTDPDLIDMVADAIEWTKIHNTDYSTEWRKILRAADIRSMWFDYAYFEAGALTIKNETEMLQGRLLSMNDFVLSTYDVGMFFYNQKPMISEQYFMLDGIFYEQLKSNVERLQEKYGK